MMRWAVCGLPVLLAWSSAMLAKDSHARAVYCTQGPSGSWGLSRFKPLIDVRAGTVFAELSMEGGVLAEARLRRFYPDSELTFDYMFDAAGRLTGLRGRVQVRSTPPAGATTVEPLELADWVGEADLFPGSDGRIPPHHVLYSRENDRIDKPEKSETYIARFNDAPVYMTTTTVPCAAKLKEFSEAEKINATQE